MQDIAETVYSALQNSYQTFSDIGVKNLLLLAAAGTAASVATSYIAEVIERNRYKRKQLIAAVHLLGPERLSEILAQEKEFYKRISKLLEKLKIEVDGIRKQLPQSGLDGIIS